jgi:NAD(P)-dependent dehydrogenase (short-subunit alcohol dehydrogenase family)
MNPSPKGAAIVTGASRGIGAAIARRLGEAQDIAGVVAFLAGPDGGWVNGQVVRANGGVA